jgi:hypothetical protein
MQVMQFSKMTMSKLQKNYALIKDVPEKATATRLNARTLVAARCNAINQRAQIKPANQNART